MTYDCIIIGGGHNGLVCAAYLARAGRSVLVLERRPFVGGACVTEELWPGCRISTAAYVVSLLLPDIERDLELRRHGYEVLRRTPSSFTPFEDGRSLTLGPDAAENHREISRFSRRDAAQFPRYEALLTSVAERLEPVLSSVPPDLLPLPRSWRRRSWRKIVRDLGRARSLHQAFADLGSELPEAIELLTGAARPILDRWFESDQLKGTLATDAVIGNFQSISAPGTSYVLLHHVMGAAGGARGVWGYVRGGMGRLAEALAAAARAAGAEIRCDSAVGKITTENGRTTGVVLADGTEVRARSVASGVDARTTFRTLMDEHDLPADFSAAVDRIDYSSASAKVNLVLGELPDFTCQPGHAQPGPQHRGTIHINAGVQELEDAWHDAVSGHVSRRPVIEMTIPSSVDSSLAPDGQYVVSLFVQYVPRDPVTGPWTDAARDALADLCLSEIARFAPNVPSAVIHRQVLTPLDLETVFGLTGGNIFQGAMPLHQLFSLRPVPGWSDYRCPVRGLYLCGSAAHPGGGVMGACGRNAAQEILRDRL